MRTSPESVSVRRFYEAAQARNPCTFIDYQAKRALPLSRFPLWIEALDANGAHKRKRIER